MPRQLRELNITLLTACGVSSPRALLEESYCTMGDDFTNRLQQQQVWGVQYQWCSLDLKSM